MPLPNEWKKTFSGLIEDFPEDAPPEEVFSNPDFMDDIDYYLTSLRNVRRGWHLEITLNIKATKPK